MLEDELAHKAEAKKELAAAIELIPGELRVEFIYGPNFTSARATEIVQSLGYQIIDYEERKRTASVSVPVCHEIEAMEKLRKFREVRRVLPAYKIHENA